MPDTTQELLLAEQIRRRSGEFLHSHAAWIYACIGYLHKRVQRGSRRISREITKVGTAPASLDSFAVGLVRKLAGAASFLFPFSRAPLHLLRLPISTGAQPFFQEVALSLVGFCPTAVAWQHAMQGFARDQPATGDFRLISSVARERAESPSQDRTRLITPASRQIRFYELLTTPSGEHSLASHRINNRITATRHAILSRTQFLPNLPTVEPLAPVPRTLFRRSIIHGCGTRRYNRIIECQQTAERSNVSCYN